MGFGKVSNSAASMPHSNALIARTGDTVKRTLKLHADAAVPLPRSIPPTIFQNNPHTSMI